MRPRLLAIVAHPDDEAFFFGGTLAQCADRWHTRLIVVTDGAYGKHASMGADGRVSSVEEPGTPAGRHALGSRRREETLASARALGIEEVEFLSYPEGALESRRQIVLCAIRRRIRDYDPTVVISLNEAGTTAHADHSWVALLTHQAVADASRESALSLAGYFTFTLTQAVDRFDHWGETVLPPELVIEVDVSDHVEQRLNACRAHESQAHWMEYLDELSLLDRSRECFVPRWLHDTGSASLGALTESVFAGLQFRTAVPMPLPKEFGYSSNVATIRQDINDRAELLETDQLRAVVLASGYGTRMNNPRLPKSLELVHGRPILDHILRALTLADIDESPIVVTGPRGDLIRQEFQSCEYVDQDVPLGTGHAVACARTLLESQRVGHVLVLNGDMPLMTPDSLREVVLQHLSGDHPVTIGVVQLPALDGPHARYAGHGRVVRDGLGAITQITEFRDADARTRELTELNAGIYCFRADWLGPALDGLDPYNEQAELYLTDVVRRATTAGEEVVAVEIPPDDALGINTRDDLAAAEEIFVRRSRAPRAPECIPVV